MQQELFTIVATQRDVTSDNQTTICVYNTFNKKDAWNWLKTDIKQECTYHGWKNIKVCLKDIEEGKYFRSPDDDPDHEYVWKVNIKTVIV